MSHPATRDVEGSFSVKRNQLLSARLTDDGSPAGAFQMTGDYSVTPGLFYATAPAGQEWHVVALGIYIAGSGNIVANGYGPLSPLANGITIQAEDALGVPLTPPFPVTVKTNGEFASFGFVSTVLDTGAGVNHVTFVQPWVDNFGTTLILRPGERFVIRTADNLTGLSDHRAGLSGYWLATP